MKADGRDLLPVTHAPSSSHQPSFIPGAIFAGCSGWAYPSWKPAFYPPRMPAARMLEHYATRLNSVEVNYTFRRLPTPTMMDRWLAQTGSGFRFSFKAPQVITHIKRLKGCSEPLSAFYRALAPAVDAGRMGVVLFQLPPNFKADAATLSAFLRDTGAAAGLRMAFEFRHDSWFSQEVFHVLKEHAAALCLAESDDLETPEIVTAPFSCYRLRKSGYPEAALKSIQLRLQSSAVHGDVFAYFKHEETPDGAFNAEALLHRLAGGSPGGERGEATSEAHEDV